MSRVGDVGVSVKDLEQIIEVDFLYGSRQQQLQRTRPLMHSEEAERHDIIMNEQEVRDTASAYGTDCRLPISIVETRSPDCQQPLVPINCPGFTFTSALSSDSSARRP